MSNPLHLGAHEGTADPRPTDDDAPASGPLDDLTSGLKAWLNIGVDIGNSLDRHTEAMNRYLARLERNTPVDWRTAKSGTYPASGVLILGLGKPDVGTRWEIQSVAVGGSDQNVSVAGTAGLYVSGMNPANHTGSAASNPAGFAGLVDQATTLPNVAFYGGRDIVVKSNEHLYLCIFGGTSGALYVATMSATVYNEAAAGGRDTITL